MERYSAINGYSSPAIVGHGYILPDDCRYNKFNGGSPGTYKIQHFGCGDYGSFGYHCDPTLYPLSSYALEGNKSEIIPVTNTNPTYVPGVAGNAIELPAPYREYIEIEDNRHPYDYDNFSVSFWIKQVFDPNAQKGQIISHSNSQTKGGWFFNSVFDSDNNYVQFNLLDRLQNSTESAEIPVSNTTFTHISWYI